MTVQGTTEAVSAARDAIFAAVGDPAAVDEAVRAARVHSGRRKLASHRIAAPFVRCRLVKR